MPAIKTLLEGKKYHLFIIAYVVLMLITNQPVAGDEVFGGVDVSAIQTSLLAFASMAAKAAFDRYFGPKKPKEPKTP